MSQEREVLPHRALYIKTFPPNLVRGMADSCEESQRTKGSKDDDSVWLRVKGGGVSADSYISICSGARSC